MRVGGDGAGGVDDGNGAEEDAGAGEGVAGVCRIACWALNKAVPMGSASVS